MTPEERTKQLYAEATKFGLAAPTGRMFEASIKDAERDVRAERQPEVIEEDSEQDRLDSEARAECEWCDEEGECPAMSDFSRGIICTRPTGHAPPHVACGSEAGQHPIVTWTDKEETK